MKKIIVCILSMVLMFSCKKTESDLELKQVQEESLYVTQLKKMGFSVNEIVEKENYFVVGEDILFTKKKLDQYIFDEAKQAKTDYIVSSAIRNNIRIRIDESLSSWTNLIQGAIDAWNNVNADIQLSINAVSPHITLYADDDPDCPAYWQDLEYSTCAMADFPSSTGYPGAVVSFNTNSTFMNTDGKRIFVITHEIGHCIGFRHTDWESYDGVYAATIENTPSSDPNSLMNGGTCGETYGLSTYDKVALCELYPNGEVSAGSTGDLDNYRSLYSYCLADGMSPEDVVGCGIASDETVYVWYNDYTVSAGKTNNLACVRSRSVYSIAPGKTANMIVGMAIADNNKCYVWYSDGQVSAGTSGNLDNYRTAYNYSCASGRTPNMIVGMGISSDDWTFAWYSDGKVSAGSTSDLDRRRSAYSYSLPSGKSVSDIVGMGISPQDKSFVWFKQ